MTSLEWAELIRAITLMISSLGTVFGGLITVQIFKQRLELASLKMEVKTLRAENSELKGDIIGLKSVVTEYTGRLNTALDTLTTRNSELSSIHGELAQSVKGLKNLQVAVEQYILHDGGTEGIEEALRKSKTDETKEDTPK